MTTQLAPLTVQHFTDNNGNLLAGGQLYTYAAGTSTPLATYTDSTGGTANANPVIMNARGEANVWTTGGLAYKFVLKDASGNLIWTVDNIMESDIASPTFTGPVTAPTFVGNLTGNVTGNASGTAANVTGTVAIANGGTGQTTGPLAGAALGAIGVGQSWQTVTRSAGVTYTNSTGRPIVVSVTVLYTSNQAWLTVGAFVIQQVFDGLSGSKYANFYAVIPNGITYSVTSSGGINGWLELR